MMIVDRGQISCLFFVVCLFLDFASANVGEADQEIASHGANDDENYDIDSLYEFLAARGRRANDHFWANRGKRAMSHDIQIRDALSNHPKPNGFIFLMGKRSLLEPGMKKNALKPNGFNFLLAGKRSKLPRPNSFLFPVKRDLVSYNIPRPNGFMFPQAMGKRAGHSNEEFYNSPRPTSFLWPTLQGKRVEENRPVWQNMVRPTGFMFSMAKGKKSGDDDLLENFEDLSEEDQQLLAFDELEAEDESAEIEKKSMTNVQPKDLNTFFAGRGKRDSRGAAGRGSSKSVDSFFAGRGKKGTDYDMFVAGRGK